MGRNFARDCGAAYLCYDNVLIGTSNINNGQWSLDNGGNAKLDLEPFKIYDGDGTDTGLVGSLDPDLVAIAYSSASEATTAALDYAYIGQSGTAPVLVVKWDGSTAIGTGSSRAGNAS